MTAPALELCETIAPGHWCGLPLGHDGDHRCNCGHVWRRRRR